MMMPLTLVPRARTARSCERDGGRRQGRLRAHERPRLRAPRARRRARGHHAGLLRRRLQVRPLASTLYSR